MSSESTLSNIDTVCAITASYAVINTNALQAR